MSTRSASTFTAFVDPWELTPRYSTFGRCGTMADRTVHETVRPIRSGPVTNTGPVPARLARQGESGYWRQLPQPVWVGGGL
jgi:hypothetical protein